MKKWQYYTEIDVTQGRMNELGARGWELVSVDNTGCHYYKRPALSGKKNMFSPERSK